MTTDSHTLNEEDLTYKYNRKKESCKQRLIPFHFTLQEWLDFHKVLYNGVQCAYLNQEFIFTKGHSRFPTIERLHDHQPYSVTNCVWVTAVANDIKDKLTKGWVLKDFNKDEKNFVKRIEKIIHNQEVIKIIQEPYQHLFKKEENQAMQEVKAEQSTTTNPEIRIAQLFAAMGSFIENKCDAKFELTYVQFKTLISRKRCQFTGEDLPEDLGDRRLWVKDKSLPVTNNNVVVCGKDLAQALDTLVVSANINFKQLQKIAKVLSK